MPAPLIRPMLAESANVDDLPRLLSDDHYFAQRKLDGQRLLVRVENGLVTAYNRAGQPKVSNLQYRILGAFEDFSTSTWVFDGEQVGDTLWLFDLVQAGSLVTGETPLEDRLNALQQTFKDWQPGPSVQLVETARTTEEKADLIHLVAAQSGEGVMFKQSSSGYRAGRRAAQWLKAKFTKDADFIVVRLRDEGKDNAVLAVLDLERGEPVEVGTVSTIGKRPAPQPGDVWTVRFLGVYDTGAPRLYQPRLIRRRTDKTMAECLIDQLDNAGLNRIPDLRTREER